jgi:hypothetical protein
LPSPIAQSLRLNAFDLAFHVGVLKIGVFKRDGYHSVDEENRVQPELSTQAHRESDSVSLALILKVETKAG